MTVGVDKLRLGLRSLLLVAGMLTLLACGAAQPAMQRPSDVVLSLKDIDCQACGERAVDALTHQPGVGEVAFDRDKAEVAVHFDAARVLPAELVRVLDAVQVQASIGAGHGSYAPQQAYPQGTDVAWISHGEAVDVEARRVPGKVTVVDFGAKWCGPCREVDKAMAALLPGEPDVVLRKIDIGDWETPVARAYLSDVSALPYVLVYGRTGKRVAAIAGLHLDQLKAAIEQGKRL
jgi:thiol-disulfide isomerase/thioredoxin